MLAMLLAAALAAAPQHDTVYLSDGGRVVGTVIEEGPQGVSVRLLDGALRRYPARYVLRVEYADGTISSPGRPRTIVPPSVEPPGGQPPAGAQQQAPPRQYRPPPPPHARPPYSPRRPRPAYAGGRMAPISPVYAVLGISGLSVAGDLEDGVAASRVFEPQLGIWLEGGVRLSPRLSLGGYLARGFGDSAEEWRSYCASFGTTCDARTGRVGLLLRHTFDPGGRSTPWIAAGTGFEFGSVTTRDGLNGWTHGSSDLFTYTGWEVLRLMAGIDLRSSPVVGAGLYGAVAWGRYTRFENADGSVDLGRQPLHATIEAGLRFTLFP